MRRGERPARPPGRRRARLRDAPRDLRPRLHASSTAAASAGGRRTLREDASACTASTPACASACPVRALEKTADGPVVYHADRCIGCRYCMVACPFGVPKYEYEKAVPYVRKCTLLRRAPGARDAPACAEVCPAGALSFGERDELLAEAERRVYPKTAAVRAAHLRRARGGRHELAVHHRRAFRQPRACAPTCR